MRPGHNLRNIKTALREVAAPPAIGALDGTTGFDVLVGYLLLDALVANRDRHEQNWAVLSPQLGDDPNRLSPSYDHASSLGFNLTDVSRKRCLEQADGVDTFARKGTAYRFEHRDKQPATLVDHAMDGLRLCTPMGRAFWRDRLRAIDLQPVLAPLEDGKIQVMSDLAVRFASALLELNLRRLRDAASSRA